MRELKQDLDNIELFPPEAQQELRATPAELRSILERLPPRRDDLDPLLRRLKLEDFWDPGPFPWVLRPISPSRMRMGFACIAPCYKFFRHAEPNSSRRDIF